MKLILNYLEPYRSRVTLGVIIKFLGTMMELVLPWNLAYILAVSYTHLTLPTKA